MHNSAKNVYTLLVFWRQGMVAGGSQLYPVNCSFENTAMIQYL
ncbi:MAG: hypothetical protein ACLUDU_16890 [Butyricimonas faecihominis]